MQNSFSILSYLRKNRPDRHGKVMIYLRVSVEAERWDFSSQRKVRPSDWSMTSARVNRSDPMSYEINRHLDELKHRLYSIHSELLSKGKTITLAKVKKKFSGEDRKEKTLLELYDEHNASVLQLVGREYSKGRYYQHRRTRNHLEDFLMDEYLKEDIPLRKINLEFINRFEYYLKTHGAGARNTVTKYVTNFKKIMRIAFANNWVKKDPFYHWKATWKPVERQALNEYELKQLMEMDLHSERLIQVRDIFLFCCFTGLAYSDVKKLSSDHIVLGMNGKRWIKTKRTKTQTRSSIPILPQAEAILEKYRIFHEQSDKGLLLPVISNQKLNDYLKEFKKRLGLNKKLTFHLARHTFATTVTLANGVPIESVSRMLGHRSLRTTQIYAKVLDKKLEMDMELVRTKFKLG